MSDAAALDNTQVLTILVGILKQMTSDRDLDEDSPIGPQTYLVADLGFESLDMVEFVILVRDAVQRPNLPFEELLVVNDRYVDDLSVGQVADFVSEACAVQREAPS
jgi:acyl carrier protein